MINPTVNAIVIAVFSALSFGGGFAVADWRKESQVAQLNSEKTELQNRTNLLLTANRDCATDIESVKKGVAIIRTLAEEREKAASDAIKAADLKVAQHTQRIRTIRTLPPVSPAPEAQCAAIVQEQVDYVQARKIADE